MTIHLLAPGDRTKTIAGILVLAATVVIAAPPAARAADSSSTAPLYEGIGMGDKPSKRVRTVQRALTSHGYSVGAPGIDGRFGPLTAGAVRRLQADSRLVIDGIVGPRTRRVLGLRTRARKRPGPSAGRTRERRAKPNPPQAKTSPPQAKTTPPQAQTTPPQAQASPPKRDVRSPSTTTTQDRPATPRQGLEDEQPTWWPLVLIAGAAVGVLIGVVWALAKAFSHRLERRAPVAGEDDGARAAEPEAAAGAADDSGREPPALAADAPPTEASAPVADAPQTEASAPAADAPQPEASAPAADAPQPEASAPAPAADEPPIEASAPAAGEPQPEVPAGGVDAPVTPAVPVDHPDRESLGATPDDERRGRKASPRFRAPAATGPDDASQHGAQPEPADRPIIGYVTVTRSVNGDRLHSQARAIDEACESAGWQLLEIVRDTYTGRALERPGLRYALERIADGQAAGLMVSDLKLLSRSVVELGALLAWFWDAGAALIALDLGVDTSTSEGHHAAAALITLSAWERERAAPGAPLHVAEGRRRGGEPGTSWIADRPDLVERIAEMKHSRMTLRAIANQLNAEQIPTVRGGTEWRPSTVQAVLNYHRGQAWPRELLPSLENRGFR
jgi:DNA invertase Pin-like site-specific DNA recombinase